MKRPLNRGTVPIGGTCRYKDPDQGFIISHPMWDWCKAQAKDERIKRGLPIPWNWDQVFEQGFCEGTPLGCYDVPDAPAETGPSWTKLALQFAGSMLKWIKAGAPVTTWEEFKARYVRCTGDDKTPQCPYFTKFAGLGIPRCGGCGCSSIKLWLKTERCPKGRW